MSTTPFEVRAELFAGLAAEAQNRDWGPECSAALQQADSDLATLRRRNSGPAPAAPRAPGRYLIDRFRNRFAGARVVIPLAAGFIAGLATAGTIRLFTRRFIDNPIAPVICCVVGLIVVALIAWRWARGVLAERDDAVSGYEQKLRAHREATVIVRPPKPARYRTSRGVADGDVVVRILCNERRVATVVLGATGDADIAERTETIASDVAHLQQVSEERYEQQMREHGLDPESCARLQARYQQKLAGAVTALPAAD
jgi:hypothetical protein